MTNMDLTPYCASHKTGRCASSAERGRGQILHAVKRGSFEAEGPALCGATPGARSVGWSCTMLPLDRVTCPRCLKRMAPLQGG